MNHSKSTEQVSRTEGKKNLADFGFFGFEIPICCFMNAFHPYLNF